VENDAALDDTHMGMCEADFVLVANDLGFLITLGEPFDVDDRKETFMVMWHPAGVLLKYDTYFGNINSASIFYNWEPHNKAIISAKGAPKLTSSGIWYPSPQDIREGRGTEDDWVWGGDWDVRVSLKLNFKNLLKYGKFIKPWKYDTGLNLLHFVDWREVGALPWPDSSKECNRRTLTRLNKMSPEVRALVPETMFPDI